MVKNDKTALGRSLVKHHNQMINQSKDKGRFYKSQHKVLESVTDVNDIDAVIQKADETERFFSDGQSVPNLLINLEGSSSTIAMTPEEKRVQQKKEEARHAGSLYIPRRPPWTPEMSKDELHDNEWKAFLIWRRNLARLEENEKLVLTPFEKNLDIWRQLWRVVERSHLVVMVVDARDPLFYRCPDLEAYVREVDKHKRTMLLVNKADLLPLSVREKWAEYFRLHNILFLFWSAKAAFAAVEGKQNTESETLSTLHATDDVDTKVYGRDELLARLQHEAEDIAKMGGKSYSHATSSSEVESRNSNVSGISASKKVMVGFVGYPNVGKSSTINALLCQKRTGVTHTPGKTKHFQTFDIIEDKLTLCDCPGLVFPSFSSSRFDMIASGVLPIDRMTEKREAVQIVANKVPRRVIEEIYKISLPKPKPYEPQNRPPHAAELLRAYCASRGYVASSGLPDETKAARQILKDYIDGKLPHYEMPPGMSGDDGLIDEDDDDDDIDDGTSSLPETQDSGSLDGIESSRENENDSAAAPVLEDVLDDLNSFDMANGIASSQKTTVKKPKAAHKQHKKPQRKKDRTWRVGNDNGDGMPIIRVYQKAANTGPVDA